MRHEIAYIRLDREALQWAFGCVSTSYVRRIASLDVMQITIVRWAVAVLIASWTAQSFAAARLFFLKVAGWPALEIVGFDYQKFMSAVNAIPTWSFLLASLAGLFYIAAAYCLIRKKVSSVSVLLSGTALSSVAFISKVATILGDLGEYRWILPAGILQRESIAFVVQFGVILLLWQGFSRGGRPRAGNKP